MNRWERYLYGAVAEERPLVLRRVVPLILTFDLWLLMIGHASRYGAAGFNVAHFAALDALPIPTPGGYIALLLLAGTGALVAAVMVRTPRRLFALVAGLYTLAWAISMLDSYQHHYFLSLVLVCLALFPDSPRHGTPPTEGDEPPNRGVPLAHGGYTALTATIAILYAYAAYAKCEPVWISGHTMGRLTTASALLGGLDLSPGIQAWLRSAAHGVARSAHAVGWGPKPPLHPALDQAVLSLLSTVAIPMEFFLAGAYALSPLRDRVQGAAGRLLRALLNFALLLALGLHLGAEGMSLSIGWFSYYMLLLALCCLGPASIPRLLAGAMGRIERAIAPPLGAITAESAGGQGVAVALSLALISAGLHLFVGYKLDLPGAWTAAAILAASALLWTGVRAMRGRTSHTVGGNLALISAGLLLWVGVSVSDARFDFYKYLGGDLNRRGDLLGALRAYEQAQRYAPPGKSRQAKIEQLRKRLGQRGPKR